MPEIHTKWQTSWPSHRWLRLLVFYTSFTLTFAQSEPSIALQKLSSGQHPQGKLVVSPYSSFALAEQQIHMVSECPQDCGYSGEIGDPYGSLQPSQAHNTHLFLPSSMAFWTAILWWMFKDNIHDSCTRSRPIHAARRVGLRRHSLTRRQSRRVNLRIYALRSRRLKAIGLQLLLISSMIPSCIAATDPNPEDHQHPSQTLQDIVEQLQLPSTDLGEVQDRLLSFFRDCPEPIPQPDYIQLYSYKPGLAPRTVFTERASLAEGLRRLRALWQEYHTLTVASVQPEPPPLDAFVEEQQWVVWEPLPAGWVVGLWDIIAHDNRLLQRQALCLPRPVALHELLRFLGLTDFCGRNLVSCRWWVEGHSWSIADAFPRQLAAGYYLRLQLGVPVQSLTEFWTQITSAPARHSPAPPDFTYRIGEASHPGPSYWFGTTNPGGLRGKEDIIAQLPEGLWCVQETHLSSITMSSSISTLKRAAEAENKGNFVLAGSPVALRARSQEAGAWAGVLIWSSGVPRMMPTQWPNGEFQAGRVLAADCWFGPLKIACINLYGWPRSPTWPRAVQATNELLRAITEEFVLSHGGPRLIGGDFNIPEDLAPSIALWKQAGWIEVQSWAQQHLQKEPEFTCKHQTTPDRIYVSPEMIPWLQEVKLWDCFSDHRPLACRIDIPLLARPQQVWPLPQEVPWEQVNVGAWKDANRSNLVTPNTASITQTFKDWCMHYEDSLDDHIKTDRQLPRICRGRGAQDAPTMRDAAPPLLRPSRPGELRPHSSSQCREVQKWFLVLRKLQSLCHALRANKDTASAQLYRAELWRNIRLTKGFGSTFAEWWPQRPYCSQAAPSSLPVCIPSLFIILTIFQDFELNYRRFEAWHARRRKELLQVTYRDKMGKLFHHLKPKAEGGLHHLVTDTENKILEVLAPGDKIRLAEPVVFDPSMEFLLGPHRVDLTLCSDGTYQADTDGVMWAGLSITMRQHHSTVDQIQTALADFWTPRWWKDAPPSRQDWARILRFARAYLPRGVLPSSSITMEQWRATNKRYTQFSAKGPDGISRLDLVHMPDNFVSRLVSQISRWEQQAEWPSSLLHGFIRGLPKKLHSQKANEFRPIVIYSMIYRSWSSLRARQALQHLDRYAGAHQFGFRPGAECAELWYVVQALVENSVQTSSPLVGVVTDLQKAFETIPRLPVKILAKWLGIPGEVVDLWHSFLSHNRRRFIVAGEVGPALASNSGYPEGCAMSCVAMTIVGLSLHAYQAHFASRSTCISYVDNIELLAASGQDLLQGFLCLQNWTDLWGLELDVQKTYCWGTTPEARKNCAPLGFQVLRDAKDLGASMTYGRGLRNRVQLDRIASLEDSWQLLRRSPASTWLKGQILRQALWPRAFHGAAVCCLADTHIQKLRTQAVKALNQHRAGAQPAVRLLLLMPPESDPGFYQDWLVFQTFDRLREKQPGILDLLHSFLDRFEGTRGNGPFHKLLETCNRVGWQLHADASVTIHDGAVISLLETPLSLLKKFLLEAWAQFLSTRLAQRHDFAGLNGLDVVVLRGAIQKQPIGSATCLDVLREGTSLSIAF